MVASYDVATKAYSRVPEETIARHLELLRPAREARRPLPIFSLDYWEPDDVETIRAIYAKERSLGHSPYVGTVLLDRIIVEPANTP